LTLSRHKENLDYVVGQIKKPNFNWDPIVKMATAHLVFPALYLNLKRAQILKYVPEDLTVYMKHITELNRERNEQIKEQALSINKLLSSHGIVPVFIKGTGNILEGLYKNIAERMIGDIDFIVSLENYQKTIDILTTNGYQAFHDKKYNLPGKHHPRLVKPNSIAAVEIHKDFVREPHTKAFNYNLIKDRLLVLNATTFLSYSDQLSLSIIAYQINDNGQFFKTINLRNAYDVFVLSEKVDALKSIREFDDFFHPLNNFLGLCNLVLSDTISYQKGVTVSIYLEECSKLIEKDSARRKHRKRQSRKLWIKQRLNIILKSFYRKDYRIWLIKLLTDKNWYKRKLQSLGSK
jgi:hypothetical protein